MKITIARPEDAKELEKLVNAAYRGEESKKGWTTEAEILDGIRIDEQALMQMLVKPEVAILKISDVDAKILGTVCLEVKSADLYLGMFAISPILQGLGYGKLLLAEAEQYAGANNCSRIVISVISSRLELINWYSRHGYVPTGHSIAFEEIPERFGKPKVETIRLIEMEKLIDL